MERQEELQQWMQSHLPDRLKSVQSLAGDASFRRYHRVFCQDDKSYILVDALPEHENSAAYLKVAKLFSNSGICVPDIYAADTERGFLLLKDFGDCLLLDDLSNRGPIPSYQQALNVLQQIQVIPTVQANLPNFDNDFIKRELFLFKDWFVEKYLGIELTTADENMLQDIFDEITRQILQQPKVCIHRDYQSRNLMVLNSGALGVIDFQDAMVGPITYDFVSLIKDCYIDWPVEIIEHFSQLFCQHYQIARKDFNAWFHMMVVQRHLKNLGIFARLAIRDQRRNYLQYYPRMINYVLESLTALPELTPLMTFFQKTIIPKLKLGAM